MIKLFDCSIHTDYQVGVDKIFENGDLVYGSFVNELELKLGDIYQMNCISFSDMTTALVQLFKSLHLKNGDVVLCHPYCCLSTTMAIKLAGLNVQWLALDKKNLCIDISSLQKKISVAKVVLNYNIGGFLPDLQIIENICSENDVIFINDCNNSDLSKIRKKFSPQYGDYSILSFYPNRNFGAIDGAAILSNKKDLSDLKKYQRLGIIRGEYRQTNGLFNPMHDVETIAGSNTMSNISAKLVLNRLKSFSKTMLEKIQTFNKISDSLKDITVRPSDIYEIVPWAIPIFVKDPLNFHHNMSKIGIETTDLHFDNSKYILFGENLNLLHPFHLMWAPLDVRIVKHSEEIIYHAS